MVAIGAASLLLLNLQGKFSEANRYEELLKLAGQRNGYGDYVRAAQALRHPERRILLNYLKDLKRDPKTVRPPSIPAGLSRLELCRREAIQFADVIGLVRQGSAKPCFFPDSKYWAGTLQPELARFKDVSRIFVDAADAAFGRGDEVEGSKFLFDSLTFSDQIAHGSMLNCLVGQTCQSMSLRAIKEHFAQFTKSDLDRLSKWSVRSLFRPVPLLYATIAERGLIRRSWDQFCRNPKADLQSSGMKEPDLTKTSLALQKLGTRERSQIYDRILARLESPWRATEKRLREPESRWHDKISIPTYVPLGVIDTHWKPADPQVVAGVFGYLKLWSALFSGWEDLEQVRKQVELAVRERAQARIAGLYAAVGRYRLLYGHLPKSLAEAGAKPLIEPTTRKPYQYAQSKDGKGFRIWTVIDGRELDLVVKRQTTN